MSVKIDLAQNPLINSTKTSGLLPDIIKQNVYPGFHVGCDIFKTASIYPGSTATFDTFIRGHVDPNKGGYYYAHAYEGTTYQSASCRIPLSQCSVLKVDKRRAFVSIGVGTLGKTYRFCDVALANDGSGWYPMCWVKDFLNADGSVKEGNQLVPTGTIPVWVKPSDVRKPLVGTAAATVKVTVGSANGKDFIRAEFSYNGATGGVEFRMPVGQCHTLVGGVPKVHFYRFMSLIPKAGDGTMDDKDGSALSAVMDTLRLGSTAWTADKVQHSFVVQTENVPTVKISNIRSGATIGTDADYANIVHNTFQH